MSDALTPVLYGRYLVALNLYYQDLRNYTNEREYEMSGQHSVSTAAHTHGHGHGSKGSVRAGDLVLDAKTLSDSSEGSDAGTSIGTMPGPHIPYELPHELQERVSNLLTALNARHNDMMTKGNILSCSVCKACIAEIETISASTSV